MVKSKGILVKSTPPLMQTFVKRTIMKAIGIDEFGGPEVIDLAEVQAGQGVLIHGAAHNADTGRMGPRRASQMTGKMGLPSR
ncbi:hypothetical protein ACQ86N_10575 [Puia sp. P3]|uniref:hypothetical protein n=1 Tax=Puia sp. P3 TaxID=3423952 RepID=UPI003D664DCD